MCQDVCLLGLDRRQHGPDWLRLCGTEIHNFLTYVVILRKKKNCVLPPCHIERRLLYVYMNLDTWVYIFFLLLIYAREIMQHTLFPVLFWTRHPWPWPLVYSSLPTKKIGGSVSVRSQRSTVAREQQQTRDQNLHRITCWHYKRERDL